LKGYPRLSETFIAQEVLGLERRGLDLELWSLRHPTEKVVHPLNRDISAPVRYLPEYLYQEPARVLKGLAAALRRNTVGSFVRTAWRDLRRDPTANRVRRIGQALVLARELPATIGHLHVHYLHTPASVVRYAAVLTGLTWSFSAHAKDIWTTPDWELREKMEDAGWGVTCTRDGHQRLAALAAEPGRVRLLYHGLDLRRFPPPPSSRPSRDGLDPADPVRIVSVGRAVEKKGFDDLLRALAALPADLHWRFAHAGGGDRLPALKALSAELGIDSRVAFVGAKAQPDIVALLREADLFVLPARQAASGDRDGLPNVILEAASQALPIVATRFAGIPEFVRHGDEGELVEPSDWTGLSNVLNRLAREPMLRARYGLAAHMRLATEFGADAGLDWLAAKLGPKDTAGPSAPERGRRIPA
jgi:glycosyltransferase involved in cell wall biosynthesis